LTDLQRPNLFTASDSLDEFFLRGAIVLGNEVADLQLQCFQFSVAVQPLGPAAPGRHPAVGLDQEAGVGRVRQDRGQPGQDLDAAAGGVPVRLVDGLAAAMPDVKSTAEALASRASA